MKKVLTTIIFVCVLVVAVSCIMAVNRPPELQPKDVPFEYDPNLCPSPPMDYVLTEPNKTFIGYLSAGDEDGHDIEFTGPPDVIIEYDRKEPDPNGGFIHYALWTFTPPMGVHYLNFRATDVMGGCDERTIIVCALVNHPPILGTEKPASAKYPQDYQKLVEQLKKRGIETSKPILTK